MLLIRFPRKVLQAYVFTQYLRVEFSVAPLTKAEKGQATNTGCGSRGASRVIGLAKKYVFTPTRTRLLSLLFIPQLHLIWVSLLYTNSHSIGSAFPYLGYWLHPKLCLSFPLIYLIELTPKLPYLMNLLLHSSRTTTTTDWARVGLLVYMWGMGFHNYINRKGQSAELHFPRATLNLVLKSQLLCCY